MFEIYWQENKNKITCVGILIAIGAIFLTIPVPNNNTAKEALLNLQLLWLLIITFGILTVCINLYLFVYKYRKKFRKKFGGKIESTIIDIIFLLAFWFLYNDWNYIYSLYKPNLESLIYRGSFLISGLVASVCAFTSRNLAKKFDKVNSSIFETSAIFASFLISGLFLVLINGFILHRFGLKISLLMILLFLLGASILSLILILIKKYNFKKVKTNEEK